MFGARSIKKTHKHFVKLAISYAFLTTKLYETTKNAVKSLLQAALSQENTQKNIGNASSGAPIPQPYGHV